MTAIQSQSKSVSPSSILPPTKKAPMKEAPMGSIIMKGQLCGKKGKCKCYKGFRHGPYCWLVSYIPKDQRPDDKKHIEYGWKYLGKTQAAVMTKLKEKTGTVTQRMAEKIQTAFNQFEADPEFRNKPSHKIKLE